MTERNQARRLTLALVLVAVGSLGDVCEETSTAADPGAATAALFAQPAATSVANQAVFAVEFRVTTDGDFRAINLNLDWDSAFLSHVATDPHPEFDDDGQFFLPITVKPVVGSVPRIVDLRHAGAPASGITGVFTAWFRAEAPGVTTIRSIGRVASGDGLASAQLDATSIITITP